MKKAELHFRLFSLAPMALCSSTAVFVSALLVVASHAKGEPIYSQVTPAEPSAAFSSVDIPVIGQKVADNFVLQGPGLATIRSLRFIGGYGLRNPPPLTPPLDALPDDDFRIVFLDDAAGSPGLPIIGSDFAVGSAFSRTPTNGQLLNGITTPLEFVLDLGVGISLSPDTEYWISVTNNPGPDHSWSWARADGVLDSDTAATFGEIVTGPWNVFTNGGMWFELNDENIPEPSSLSIVALAATAAFLLRSRCSSADSAQS